MTTNQGFWEAGIYGTADRLNAGLLQIGAVSAIPAAGQAGRMYMSTDTATKGKLYRDSGSAWVEVILVDAAAGTASLRTLSTTATTAAAGNHTHTFSQASDNIASGTAGDQTGANIGTSETDICSVAVTAAKATNAMIVHASVTTSNATTTARLYAGASAIETRTSLSSASEYILQVLHLPGSTSSVTYKVTVEATTAGANNTVHKATLGVYEVTI